MATKAKSKATKKTVKKSSMSLATASLTAASSVLFAGVIVVLVGNIQDRDDMKLLLVGFGAALLIFGGVLLGASAKMSSK